MKIEDKRKSGEVIVSTLLKGDVFEYDSMIFIKIDPKSPNLQNTKHQYMFNVTRSNIWEFLGTELVKPIFDASLTLK